MPSDTVYLLDKCSDKKLWDSFVLNSPQSNLFCQTKFLDVFQKEYELFFVYKGDSILLGAIIAKDDGAGVSNQILFKQLKNRYSDISMNSKFLVNVVKKKMKLIDIEEEIPNSAIESIKQVEGILKVRAL